jgi:SAM-dependent methyltransferase
MTAPASRDLILACPRCHGGLQWTSPGALCRACGQPFPERDAFLDFAPQVPVSSVASQPGAAQRYMEDPAFIDDYVRTKRAFFVRTMGGTWGASFTHSDEEVYIRTFATPGEGPVLDLACGPGQYTRILTAALGTGRVLGLDLSFPMLAVARRAVPEVLLVRGSASSLPIRTGTLGGILCWNALQLFPDPPRAIREAFRVLRPGGTLTCFTYRRSVGAYRLVQRAWEWLMKGVQAFDERRLLELLQDAGFSVLDLRGPRSILRFSARKA